MAATPKKRIPKQKATVGTSKKPDSAPAKTKLDVPDVSALGTWTGIFRPGSATLAVGAFILLGVAIGGAYAVWPNLSQHFPTIVRANGDPRLTGMEGRVKALEGLVHKQKKQDDEIKSLEAQRSQFTKKLSHLMARLEKQEKALDAVTRMAQATTSASVSKDAKESLQRLSGRLAHLEQGGEDLSGFMERIVTLEKKTAREKADVKGQKKREKGSKNTIFLPRKTLLAVLQVREALRSSAPFADDLLQLKKLTADKSDIKKLIAVLEPYMKSGILTLAVLRSRFESVAADIVQKNQKTAGEGWIAISLDRLSSLVSIRKTGANVKGSDVQSIVARTEGVLKTADLPAAIKSLNTLPENSKAVAADWIRAAKARVTAERAIAVLHVYAVAYMAPAAAATAHKTPAKE